MFIVYQVVRRQDMLIFSEFACFKILDVLVYLNNRFHYFERYGALIIKESTFESKSFPKKLLFSRGARRLALAVIVAIFLQ